MPRATLASNDGTYGRNMIGRDRNSAGPRIRLHERGLIGGLALLTLVAAQCVGATVEDARTRALGWLLNHQAGDGSWQSAPGLTVHATGAAVLALGRAGVGGYPYLRGVSWLSNATPGSVEGVARGVLALSEAGTDTTAQVAGLLALRNVDEAWGAYDGFGTSHPDTALALSAVRADPIAWETELGNGGYWVALCRILGAQDNLSGLPGSWAYLPPSVVTPQSFGTGAVTPTAFNLFELTATRSAGYVSLTCSEGTYDLSSAIDSAAGWLLGRQQSADGGFGSGDSSLLLETAFTYRALEALVPTDAQYDSAQAAMASARDYLIESQRPDGSWGDDAFLTAATLNALGGAYLLDTDGDGLPDAIEDLVGTNRNLADGRTLWPGNGHGMAGTGTPLTYEATQGVHVHASLPTLDSGAPPFTWLVTGELPSGLVLDEALGAIVGTPASAGPYNFLATVTDAGGRMLSTTAQFLVFADTDGDGLRDADELSIHGTDPLNADSDRDGVLDGDEVAGGRNPLVNESVVLSIIRAMLEDADPDDAPTLPGMGQAATTPGETEDE